MHASSPVPRLLDLYVASFLFLFIMYLFIFYFFYSYVDTKELLLFVLKIDGVLLTDSKMH
jgi:hypothetical protein